MGAMQLVTAYGTAIGATLAALTPVVGDSLVVPNFDPAKKGQLLQAWATTQAAGTGRIRSTRMNDNVSGIRVRLLSGEQKPWLPWGVTERLYPNDTVNIDLAGSATAGDLEYVSMLQYFEDIQGVNARFLSPDDVARRLDHILTVENTLATPTSGGYAASAAINATIDQFQAGLEYAILGYRCDTKTHAIGYRSQAWGNLRIGGPGDPNDFDLYSNWFVRLSKEYGLNLIPVFNGTDKGAVLIDAVQDENGADPVVTTYLARLKPA